MKNYCAIIKASCVCFNVSAGLIDYFSSADSIPRSQILFYEYYKAIESQEIKITP